MEHNDITWVDLENHAKASSSQAELQILTVSQKLAIFIALSSVSPLLA